MEKVIELKKKDKDGKFVIRKQGERTKNPELPWNEDDYGDESIDARTYGFEFIKHVSKEDELQSFHCPIPKYRGGAIPASLRCQQRIYFPMCYKCFPRVNQLLTSYCYWDNPETIIQQF